MMWVRRSVALWLIGMLSLLALPSAFGQAAAPDLEVDAVSARSSTDVEATRVDVYTRVPYSSLRFLATNNAFEARYEVTIGVHELEGEDRGGNLVQSRIFEQEVRAADFAQTQTDQLFDRTIQSLELVPGRYLLEFQVDDQASNRSFVKELPIRVRDLSRSFALSDLILIDAYDAGANSITPTVSSRVGSDQDQFKLFYEIYADANREVRIRREMAHIPRSSGLPSVKSLLGFGAGDDLSDAEISYQETLPQTVRSGRNQYVVEIPIRSLEVGDYVARVIVEDLSGNELDRAERAVTLQWTGLAEHVRDLDAAIDQLSYIAKRNDLEYIRSGRTEQERLARFREFWDRRDPTPNSERNERMEEYYYRIAYANSEYGNFGNGWQTDRGQVMVLFGEPDHVDRHPFNFNVKPYEVWYYYRIGRRFVFIDDTGLGDYELLVPYWDDRTRLR
ncbi:MAG: GWxTD domain-containing protein [Rhodothermales bacterium]